MKILRISDHTPAWTLITRVPAGQTPVADHIHLDTAELFILEGSGYHPETGSFKAGDFIFEQAGARHGRVEFHEDCTLLFKSAGACVMLDADGNPSDLLDAESLRRLAAEHGAPVPVGTSDAG